MFGQLRNFDHIWRFINSVITDHSLRWLHHLKNPISRLVRWALELEYDYEIVYWKGALHHVSDALSRAFESNTNEGDNVIVSLIITANAPIIDNTDDLW